jgi:hypothetical protein
MRFYAKCRPQKYQIILPISTVYSKKLLPLQQILDFLTPNLVSKTFNYLNKLSL